MVFDLVLLRTAGSGGRGEVERRLAGLGIDGVRPGGSGQRGLNITPAGVAQGDVGVPGVRFDGGEIESDLVVLHRHAARRGRGLAEILAPVPVVCQRCALELEAEAVAAGIQVMGHCKREDEAGPAQGGGFVIGDLGGGAVAVVERGFDAAILQRLGDAGLFRGVGLVVDGDNGHGEGDGAVPSAGAPVDIAVVRAPGEERGRRAHRGRAELVDAAVDRHIEGIADEPPRAAGEEIPMHGKSAGRSSACQLLINSRRGVEIYGAVGPAVVVPGT